MKKFINAAGLQCARPSVHSPGSCGPRAHGRTGLSFILHPGLHIESLIFSKLTKLSHCFKLLYYMEAALEEHGDFFFSPPQSSRAKLSDVARNLYISAETDI